MAFIFRSRMDITAALYLFGFLAMIDCRSRNPASAASVRMKMLNPHI